MVIEQVLQKDYKIGGNGADVVKLSGTDVKVAQKVILERRTEYCELVSLDNVEKADLRFNEKFHIHQDCHLIISW